MAERGRKSRLDVSHRQQAKVPRVTIRVRSSSISTTPALRNPITQTEGDSDPDESFEAEFSRELEQDMSRSSNENSDEDRDSEVIRVRRGKKGKFVSYSEGASSSEFEPKRKVRAGKDDTSWILKDAAPGGPFEVDVIPSFGGHIAYELWTCPESERKLLTKYTRERTLVDLRGWQMSDRVLQMVEASGFSHLRDIMLKNINMPLLCAFIERWQPDTNTFHMPWGEMTILLHDVEEILGIPSDGRVCSIPAEDLASPVRGMSELFSMTEVELAQAFNAEKNAKIYKGNLVLARALKELLSEERLGAETEAQAYLLTLLGSTLFVEKSGDRVRANMFPMLRDVESINDYAWGAGTLAYMYRQLGIATRSDCRGLCGCLTLLQCWIFEYFPSFRPNLTTNARRGEVRARCWDSIGTRFIGDVSALKAYRRQIDHMLPETVTWVPYEDPPETEHPRSLFTGLLRFVDIVEPYQPDRCLRQFGYRQRVPVAMVRPDRAYRPRKSSSYEVEFLGSLGDQHWTEWRDHRVVIDRVATIAFPPHSSTDDYKTWYIAHSHPYIIVESEPSSPLATDKAHIVGTVGVTVLHRFSKYDSLRDEERHTDMDKLYTELGPQLRDYHGRTDIGIRNNGDTDVNEDGG